jgi:hypothetical protein
MDDKKLQTLVPLKHSLKQSFKFQDISSKLLCRLKDIPNVGECKLDVELIKFVCSNIEILCKKKYKIDKLELLLFTMKKLVDLTAEDEQHIKSVVEFLHTNKLIKLPSNLVVLGYGAKQFFLKK